MTVCSSYRLAHEHAIADDVVLHPGCLVDTKGICRDSLVLHSLLHGHIVIHDPLWKAKAPRTPCLELQEELSLCVRWLRRKTTYVHAGAARLFKGNICELVDLGLLQAGVGAEEHVWHYVGIVRCKLTVVSRLSVSAAQ